MPEDGDCPACGEPLVREKWNSSVDLITCDNYKCNLFRTSIGVNKAGEVIDKSVGGSRKGASRKKDFKVPEWLGGPDGSGKAGSFKERVQRLRHRLLSEDEETEVP